MGFAFNHLNSVTDVRIEWESHQNENYGKEKKGKKRKRGGSQTPGFSPFQPRRRQQIITHPKLKFYQRWALSSLSLCAQPKTSVPLSACHAAASHQIQSHSGNLVLSLLGSALPLILAQGGAQNGPPSPKSSALNNSVLLLTPEASPVQGAHSFTYGPTFFCWPGTANKGYASSPK